MKKYSKILFALGVVASLSSIAVFGQASVDPGEGSGGECVTLQTNDATCRGGDIIPKCGFVISGPQVKDCNFTAST
ncbi:hypothetical protein Aoki45_39300 [Algoriphagus sp. oki45]|uniref:hypothetical protein n=1 Tax=Algoriphagus sp. oki45 TaxID=3067294 RepID=UPI0027E6FE26|nr:hypothetical protein Aoki45_39300 [Algoriphagus sp. oki45]